MINLPLPLTSVRRESAANGWAFIIRYGLYVRSLTIMSFEVEDSAGVEALVRGRLHRLCEELRDDFVPAPYMIEGRAFLVRVALIEIVAVTRSRFYDLDQRNDSILSHMLRNAPEFRELAIETALHWARQAGKLLHIYLFYEDHA